MSKQQSLYKESLLSHSELLSILDYNQDTGIFTWKVHLKYSNMYAGDIAGNLNIQDGYIQIMVNKASYRAHRLAWFYVTGQWPINTIDHDDTIKHHNWFSNLREATHNEQQQNKPLSKNNTSGVKGVHWNNSRKMWYASIKLNSKRIFLGSFINKADAIQAVTAAREKYHKQFSNMG
jgi:hypothetical protein